MRRSGSGSKRQDLDVDRAGRGRWRVAGQDRDGETVLRDAQLTLHQRFSEVTGTLHVAGLTDRDRYTLTCGAATCALVVGRVCHLMGMPARNIMQGSLSTDELPDHVWNIKRDKVDLTGAWEWPCLSGSVR